LQHRAVGLHSLSVAGGGVQVIEFECSGHRFGVPLASVRRVVMSAQPAPLPGAPDPVLGVLNVAGETVTVIDFGAHAGLGATTLSPSQHFLILDLSGFLAALVVDHIRGVAERDPAAGGAAPDKVASAQFIDSIVRLDDGLCLVVDPDKFLFEQEKAELAAALAGAGDE
jgi:chemotaxis signal transduction protein